VQHKFDKARAFKGKQGTIGGVDLMIVDILEGLPVPMVSSPPTSVPEWNSNDKNFLAMVFDIGSSLICKGLPLQDLEGMDGNKPFANDQYQRCIKDIKWFQPCHLHHSFRHMHLKSLCC
jgi:hypothetical protein